MKARTTSPDREFDRTTARDMTTAPARMRTFTRMPLDVQRRSFSRKPLTPEGHHVHPGDGQAEGQGHDHLQVAGEMIAVDERPGHGIGAEHLLIEKDARVVPGQLEEAVEGLEDARADEDGEERPDLAAPATVWRTRKPRMKSAARKSAARRASPPGRSTGS